MPFLKITAPESESSSFAISLRRVDLPVPFLAIKPTLSPLLSPKEMFLNNYLIPKVLDRFSTDREFIGIAKIYFQYL